MTPWSSAVKTEATGCCSGYGATAEAVLHLGREQNVDLYILGGYGSPPAIEVVVGSTVDLQTATYTNAIGSPELMGSWSDPAFDTKQHAIYYVRVLEIPTPRFTTYDAVRNNLPLLKDVPATLQERAWTSPIWVSPQ